MQMRSWCFCLYVLSHAPYRPCRGGRCDGAANDGRRAIALYGR